MDLKQKMSFILISIILLSATALAAPTADCTNAKKAPVAAFSASPTSGYAPLKVQFTDKSKYLPTSWKWSFGDGTYSTAKNPVHTYSKVGKYTVTLAVKNSKGSNKITRYSYITVLTPSKNPLAAFSASPTSGYTPLKVQFTDNSTGTPASWKWNFGDGSNSTEKNPAHTYNETGKYNVSLTVKNVKGTDKITKYSYITVDSSTAIDPVCKMKVDKATTKFTSEYEGTTYYFCSASCKEKFDENPEKYVSSEISENNSDSTENATQEDSEQVTSAATNITDSTSSTVVDIVCKMKIDKNIAEFKSEYKGTTYYFCALSCKQEFDENPEKYINSKDTESETKKNCKTTETKNQAASKSC